MSIKREAIRNINHKLIDEIVEDEAFERFQSCYQCGTCTGGCPSGRRTAMRTRELIREALMGLNDELLSSDLLWLCATCYTCFERCPRQVPVTDIILKLRNIASHNGFMRGPHIAVCENLMKTGHGVPINDATKLFRTYLKLQEVPPTTHAFPEALAEVQAIVHEMKFDELVAYGKEMQQKMVKKDEEMLPQKIASLETQLNQLKQQAAPKPPAVKPAAKVTTKPAVKATAALASKGKKAIKGDTK